MNVMSNNYYKTQRFKIMALILLLILMGSIYIRVYQPELLAELFRQQVDPVTTVLEEVNQENVHLQYPQVAGLVEEAVQNKINRQIENKVHAFKEPVTDKNHTVDSRYALELNKNNILSLTLTESHYRKQAAHPMRYMKGMTLNTKTGQVYQLKDLFTDSSAYQSRLTGLINQQIVDQGLHLLKPFEGVKSDQEFYLTADGVVIYYQLYDYTPYVWGFLKFNIPYEQVADIMQRGFLPTRK